MSAILNQQSDAPVVVTPEMFLSRVEAWGGASKHSYAAVQGETRMPSLGILDKLLADDSISDILVNGTECIFVDRAGQLVDSGLRFSSHAEVWAVAERIVAAIGAEWNPERPVVDTRLSDGSRVNIVGPPIAIDGVSISIRKFPKSHITLDSMVDSGQIPVELATFLKECARLRLNILISGGTSTGKTTLLNALSAAIPTGERIVTIEDSAELRLQQPSAIRLETRPASPGAAEVTARDLVKNALRMRPDRIVVGESRGAEAFEVLQAMNTGHDGSMTTLHANTPRDALSRLESMVMIAMPALNVKVVRQQISSALQVIIQIVRAKDGIRHISHVSEVCGMEGDTIIMQDLLTYVQSPQKPVGEYRWGQGAPRTAELMEAARAAGFIKGMR